ncbi:unnamed protein product [Acanthoscelides obtectus]|uniref:HTH CENPB-type domain-containing protein n=1 Tax=Acanthoscelides obtectus TaxID=200917 RepID=A0A9P0LI49_ACAOB|nr:unnamed protein product [Acanthoscelides obtectus]CAK1621069.1 hypothetical protein AOBTE_LOCUS741 [Acanthoscelides obtectus]
MVRYILEMEALYYRLSRKDIRKLAYTSAIKNGIENPFKNGSWLDGFLTRHKKMLSLRTPTGTSFARALGFNKANVEEFFNNLETQYKAKNFSQHQIYETGLTVVQSKVMQVVGRKGKRQNASAERGSLVALISAMGVGGHFVPPMLIFPRKNRNDQLMRGAPPGSMYAVHSSGWVQHNLFVDWMKHFIEFVKPSDDSPVLLLLNGHYSHTRNLQVVLLAKENH